MPKPKATTTRALEEVASPDLDHLDEEDGLPSQCSAKDSRLRFLSVALNGADKLTLIGMIAMLQEPDAGTIHLGTFDDVEQKDTVRQTLGYLLQEFGVFPKVSAEHLLDHFGVLKGITERRAARSRRIDTVGRVGS